MAMDQSNKLFNPNEHLMQIKNRGGSADYLPVQWRLVWFRSIFPQGTIDTEELEVDFNCECEAETSVWNNETRRSDKVLKKAKGYARYRAVVCDGLGGRATGTKSERAVDFPDFVEKAETGAIGRALAALGYGTQFTGDEFDERHRIVDAPVDRGQQTPTESATPAPVGHDPQEPMSEQQRSSLHKLYHHLGKAEPQDLDSKTYLAAKSLIAQLSQEYRASRVKA